MAPRFSLALQARRGDTQRVNLDPVVLRREAPTPWPMAAPWPALVAITDTNALLLRTCNEVRFGPGRNDFRRLSSTGRSNTFVAAHVPGELVKYLPAVAAQVGVELDGAEASLRDEVMSAIPVVDLPIRDFLHPRIRPMLSDDPALPLRLRGDPDDLGTAALAEFLAPAIILSADSVFERFGISGTAAINYVETARLLTRMAGFEANLADAVALVNGAVRAIGFLGTQAIQGLRQHPYIGLAIGGVMLCVAYRFGYFKRDRIQDGLRELGKFSGEILDATAHALNERETGRQALRAVEPYGPATVEQAAARYLARCSSPLTPRDLRDRLALTGERIPATALKQAMREHPAFLRATGDVYGVGKAMNWENAL